MIDRHGCELVIVVRLNNNHVTYMIIVYHYPTSKLGALALRAPTLCWFALSLKQSMSHDVIALSLVIANYLLSPVPTTGKYTETNQLGQVGAPGGPARTHVGHDPALTGSNGGPRARLAPTGHANNDSRRPSAALSYQRPAPRGADTPARRDHHAPPRQ